MKRMKLTLACALVGMLLFTATPISGAAQTQTLDALAAKGEALAKLDPLAAELRSREPSGPSRRGFDIGMAAAEGHTAPGPGKDRLRNSLIPAEREGFNTAVSFSLERNSNAVRAAKGAEIAKADPLVASARTVDQDVFYWLGFDIATGMFGDPALGAEGKTATGPGSLKTRDALSAAGQRGFNAAVAFHLGRSYKGTPGGVTAAGKDGSGAVLPGAYGGLADPKSAPVTKVGGDIEAANLKAAAIIKANLAFISDVQVRPDVRDVIISFTSTQKTPPLIEIGKVAPALDPKGILAFPADSGAFSRFVPGENGKYTLNLGTLGEQLDIGSRYFYIINVFNDDKKNTKRPREQVTGKFVTLPQTIKVVFTEIYIFPFPSDRKNHSDFVFQFGIDALGGRKLDPLEEFWGSRLVKSKTLGVAHQPLKLVWRENPIQLEIVLEYAPDAIVIGIAGEVPNLQYFSQKILREDYEYKNGASGSFDLSAYPGDSVSIPFTLTSSPARRRDKPHESFGLLGFQITGRIEITRHRPDTKN